MGNSWRNWERRDRKQVARSEGKEQKKCVCVTLPGFQQDREVRGQSAKNCLTAGCRGCDGALTRDKKTAGAHHKQGPSAGSWWQLSEEGLSRAEERGTCRADRRPAETMPGGCSRQKLKKWVNFRFSPSQLLEVGHWRRVIIFTPIRFRMDLNSHREPLPETYQKTWGIQISGHSGWEGKREACPNE